MSFVLKAFVYNEGMVVLLRRFNPEENMNRWYMVQIQPTLLDPIAVICSWGNRDTSWARSRILPMDSLEQAKEEAEKIIAAKIKRGYKRIR